MADEKTDEKNSTEKTNRVKIDYFASGKIVAEINPGVTRYDFAVNPHKQREYAFSTEMIEDVDDPVVIPDDSDVPDYVCQAIEDDGYRVVTGVDTGWHNWEGRPEWSDRYVDFGEAEFWSSEE